MATTNNMKCPHCNEVFNVICLDSNDKLGNYYWEGNVREAIQELLSLPSIIQRPSLIVQIKKIFDEKLTGEKA